MKAIYALTWKEGREALPKVLIALSIGVVVYLMRQDADFNRNYSEDFEGMIDFSLLAIAALLAMDAVAGERSKGTISFLLGRPLGAAPVLAVKFLVGLGGVLLCTLAAWATVYLDLAGLDVGQVQYEHGLTIVQDVDYGSMVWLSFTTYAVFYALVFVGSAMTDNPFKGVSIGAALSIFLLIIFEWPAKSLFPALNRYAVIEPGFSFNGHIVRMAADPGQFWVKVLSNLGGAVLFLLASVALLRRFRGAVVEWRSVGIGWGAVIGLLLAGGLVADYDEVRMPVGALAVPDNKGPRYMHIDVQGDWGYLTTRGGIAVADLSDPRQMREVGSAKLPFGKLWHAHRVAVVDSLAYVVGRLKGLPSDSLGVVIFDIGDPAAPVYRGRQMFAATKGNAWWQDWVATDGGFLLARRRDDALVLQSFVLGGDGVPRAASEAVIEEIPAELDEADRRRRTFHMHLHGNHVYAAAHDNLVVVDAVDLTGLRVTGRFELESYRDHNVRFGSPRIVAAAGDRLYVERYWPREMAEFDISNPDQPREVDFVVWDDQVQDLHVENGMAFGRAWDNIKVWSIADFGALVIESEWEVPDEFSKGHSNDRIVLSDGYMYLVMGGTLIAYNTGGGLEN